MPQCPHQGQQRGRSAMGWFFGFKLHLLIISLLTIRASSRRSR
ncbi:MAG: hypothetical protein F4X84_07400 [Synechococcus sp. SB0662_bin_45]|nr:hypothetical protein [Synechococcus sp. SB0668_bin_13]MYE22157.1 hypothetical protein [Synechococcus sp. SB0662_bin_45]MYG63884.1 hypothetical protein [Synechococcus sp. SB0675_bin_7]MYK86725.1 hypothetical protein [Synechococcus sp. SB0669_bin_7]